MIVLFAVLALDGCGSGDNGPTLISVGGPSLVGGLSPGSLSQVRDGQFQSGDRTFYIFTNTKNGRLYAGALNVVVGRAFINCLDQNWVLQPDYSSVDGGPTSGYIDNNKFTMTGTWANRRRDFMPGSATGTISADGQRVTISWPKPARCFEQGGNNVLFIRTN